MRLLIRLRCIERSPYEMQYHYHLQGFIYNLLKGSRYHHIHDKEGYKFFCFSNIFPATSSLEKNDARTLIVSSPDREFILHLYDVLQKWIGEIKISNMRFKISYAEKLSPRIPSGSFALITGTPIIIRVPREKYDAYGVRPKGDYNYVYWRSDHPIDLFVSQLENNLTKKYAEYFGFDAAGHGMVEDLTTEKQVHIQFFQKFWFKKQISTRVSMKGFDQVVIGTVWEFGFNEGANRDMIQFALDCGLGERNSLGFGFMNVC